MSTTLLWGIAGAFNTLLAAGLQLALLIVALTVVQQRRPDAAALFLASSAIDLIATVLAFPIPMLLSRYVGIAQYAEAQAVSTAVFAVIHSVAKLFLIFGVVKLTRPQESL